jgi:hypothetical protein
VILCLLATDVTAAAETTAATPGSWLSRHRRTLLWLSGATAVTAGGVAYVSRRRANDRFEEYARAADPERIAALYDEATRLDHRAAALYITAEVAFATALILAFFVPDPDEHAGHAAAGDATLAVRVGDGDGAVVPAPRSGAGFRLAPRGVALTWSWCW